MPLLSNLRASVSLWFNRLFRLARRDRFDADMAEEMRAHVDEQTRRYLAAGLSPADARAAARRRFGGVEQLKEHARDQFPGQWVMQAVQDVRYALRRLAHAPGFTATVVLTLGLGVGACTGVFSVIDGLLLRPIGHDPHPENEVRLFETQMPRTAESRISPANFLDWQQRAKSFSAIRAGAPADLTLTGAGEPRKLVAARATQQLLEVHGWPLALGRGFLPEEDKPGGEKVILLSWQIWQQHLGGDPAAVGRLVQINGEPYTLVGVISEEVGRYSAADAFVPMAFTDAERARRANRSLGAWARLAPGVTIEQARAEMDVIAAQLAREYADTNAGWGAAMISVVDLQGRDGLREALWTLLGAVGCVLLIACANVANLLLARATVQHREFAVRSALGAGRGRLVRQLLTESLLLALLGGAVGVLFAHAGLQAVHAYAGPGMQRLGYLELNRGMLALALGLAVTTGLVFGLAPAWLAARVDLNEALKRGGRGSAGGGSGRGRMRAALVVVEVALALVLLAGAGGLIRRLEERARLDPGFTPEQVAVLQLNLGRQAYATPPKQVGFVDTVLTRLRAAPGVQAAGATSALPMPQGGRRFEVEGGEVREWSERPLANAFAVTPDYFAALDLRLVRGRAFSEHDDARGARVAIVNETLARQFFANENPIGRRIRLSGAGADVWREIVGVAADVTLFGANVSVTPQIYEPWAQTPGQAVSFVARTTTEPAASLPSLKALVYAVDPNQPVQVARPLRELLDDRIAGQRFAMHLLAVFAGIALLIAAVGIYAVIAYAVSQRTSEIGIRMALGAQRGDVVRLVFGFGGRVIGLGLIAGVAAVLAAGSVVEAMLYNVEVRDPLTLVGVALLLAGAALLACILPTRRATNVSPMTALRAE